MDTKDLAEKGLKLRKELFGDKAVEQRMNAFGEFGEPLQHIINAYAYGDVWSRPGLSLGVKSLAMIAMMAAANRPAELRVHLKGALKNGCTPEEIREVLLLVALYCGIPAANEAHRAAMDVLAEEQARFSRVGALGPPARADRISMRAIFNAPQHGRLKWRRSEGGGVYRIVDVVGVSKTSWEDAGRRAVETAATSLRDLRVAEVTKMDMTVENGKVSAEPVDALRRAAHHRRSPGGGQAGHQFLDAAPDVRETAAQQNHRPVATGHHAVCAEIRQHVIGVAPQRVRGPGPARHDIAAHRKLHADIRQGRRPHDLRCPRLPAALRHRRTAEMVEHDGEVRHPPCRFEHGFHLRLGVGNRFEHQPRSAEAYSSRRLHPGLEQPARIGSR